MPPSSSARYLGVYFDQRLTYREHIRVKRIIAFVGCFIASPAFHFRISASCMLLPSAHFGLCGKASLHQSSTLSEQGVAAYHRSPVVCMEFHATPRSSSRHGKWGDPTLRWSSSTPASVSPELLGVRPFGQLHDHLSSPSYTRPRSYVVISPNNCLEFPFCVHLLLISFLSRISYTCVLFVTYS